MLMALLRSAPKPQLLVHFLFFVSSVSQNCVRCGTHQRKKSFTPSYDFQAVPVLTCKQKRDRTLITLLAIVKQVFPLRVNQISSIGLTTRQCNTTVKRQHWMYSSLFSAIRQTHTHSCTYTHKNPRANCRRHSNQTRSSKVVLCLKNLTGIGQSFVMLNQLVKIDLYFSQRRWLNIQFL